MGIRERGEKVMVGCEENKRSYSHVSEGRAVESSRAEPAIAEAESSTLSSTEEDEEWIETKVIAPQTNSVSATTVKQMCVGISWGADGRQVHHTLQLSHENYQRRAHVISMFKEGDYQIANPDVTKVKEKCEPVPQFCLPSQVVPPWPP